MGVAGSPGPPSPIGQIRFAHKSRTGGGEPDPVRPSADTNVRIISTCFGMFLANLSLLVANFHVRMLAANGTKHQRHRNDDKVDDLQGPG